MSRSVVKSESFVVAGPAGVLEAVVDSAGPAIRGVAVLCHPHPQQQGTMQNKVVTTLARAFAHLGAAAVRFNFRGVGASTGCYADGIGERDDARAVVVHCRQRWPTMPLYLGGFSFGGAVALAIAREVAPQGLVTVAPAVSRLPAGWGAPVCPWLLVHGEADDVVPLGPVTEWAVALAVPPRIVVLPQVGHFFHGALTALSEAVTEFFRADFATAPARRSV
jgi:uncharacterized protein